MNKKEHYNYLIQKIVKHREKVVKKRKERLNSLD